MAKKKKAKVSEAQEAVESVLDALIPSEPKDPERFLAVPEKERTFDQIIEDPRTIQTICENVAEGGSLVALARLWQIPYSKLLRWVRSDTERNTAYTEALADRQEWTKETVLMELRSLSASDIRQAYDDNGRLLHPNQWPDSLAKAVAGFEIFEEFQGAGENREYIGDTKKLKLWDKLKSLELVGKTMAMFVDKTEHTGRLTLEQLLAGSYTAEELKEINSGNSKHNRSTSDGKAHGRSEEEGSGS